VCKIFIFLNVLKNEKSIIWNTSSEDALGSMLLSLRMGAGENVWVQDSSIWVCLAHILVVKNNAQVGSLFRYENF
jgi:hypothetical protein